MALSPVTAATKFIIQLKEKRTCSKDEGRKLCFQLVEWIQDPTHPDYYEAATLPFFLAQKLLTCGLITRDDYNAIRINAAKVIQQTRPEPVPKPTSTHHDICVQWNAFLKDSQATREQGLDLFERLIQWISVSSKGEYDGSTITIFSMALELEKKGVTPEEKDILFNRAFQVILKDPEQPIENRDLVEFLRNRKIQVHVRDVTLLQ